MIRVGITGQPGFVGTHLYNELGLFPDEFLRIPFEDSYFQSEEKLRSFVRECDVIVHLAAMNRHCAEICRIEDETTGFNTEEEYRRFAEKANC